jgi:fatty acid desaturase
VRALVAGWRYALTNALLLAFIAALALGGWPIWAVLAASMLIGGTIDEAAGDDDERLGGRSRMVVDANLYVTLPLLIAITCLLFRLVAPPAGATLPFTSLSGLSPRAGTAPIAAVFTAGYFYALAGATAAHELTHRVASPLALVSARMLLAFILNPTFETYHVHGHHRNVGTYNDPATARRGEYVLAFVARTVIRQSIQGWRLEAERLHRAGTAVWSWRNRVLAGISCSLAIIATAAWMAGIAGVIAFLAAAIVGRVFHEMVNYVQHYGIIRIDGSPVAARHAWDSRRLISNALFYNLPRHADHHMFAAKPLWQLASAADSPKLPHGYQTMSLIALCPPWWRRVVNPLLADWDVRLANESERAVVRKRGWTMPERPDA